MTMRYRHRGVPWIYRPVRQLSIKASRRWLRLFLVANIAISIVSTYYLVTEWRDIPGSAIPGGILVLFAGVYAFVGLAMMTFKPEVFD